jgi:zinc transporter 1/2/3
MNIWLSLINIALVGVANAHGTHGKAPTPLSAAERERECELVEPDLYDYNMTHRIVVLISILAISLLATLLPLIYERASNSSNRKIYLSNWKLFGAGVLISTAFVHMFAPSVSIFTNKCFPDIFIYYRNWPATIFLSGLLFTHFVQTQIAIYLSTNSSPVDHNSKDVEGCDSHAHYIVQKNSILAYALEFGICSHSIVVGFTLGTVEEGFWGLAIAILIHQFFEGLALSSVVIEAGISRWAKIQMVITYSISTPTGVLIGILVRSCLLLYL